MIQLRDLNRSFNGQIALSSVTFEVKSGETVAIMGASGAGKTTLLRCIAGLDNDFAGNVQIDGIPGNEYLDRFRPAMVFQHYTNFHWMTVRDNLTEAFRGRPGASMHSESAVIEVLNAVGLGNYRDHYITALSGGMQQRVAVARALLQDSDIVLLDEPFGALDIVTRAALQDFSREQFRRFSKTVLFVTHDPTEALYVSDRVLVLRRCGEHEVVCSPVEHSQGQEAKTTSTFLVAQQQIIRTMMNPGGVRNVA